MLSFFSRSRLIIIGLVVLVITIFALIFSGVIPGLRQDIGQPTNLTIWGVYDDSSVFASAISTWQTANPGFTVSYIKKNSATYETDLLNALALGAAPDIVMVHNTWLPRYIDKLTPHPTLVSKNLRELFPNVITQDFTSGGATYALPLYLDTLGLYYNDALFNAAGLTKAPTTWAEFLSVVNQLKLINEDGTIKQAGVALGGTDLSIAHAGDIISLFMLQSGTKMVSDDGRQATFSDLVSQTYPARTAVSFYTSFTNPASANFTWTDGEGSGLSAFANSQAAMVLGYAYDREAITQINPFLEFISAPIPQLAASPSTEWVSFPDYWGLSVLGQSANPQAAWQFISYLTTNESAAASYASSAKRPPALRSSLSACRQNEYLDAFCRQSLIARSWPQVDRPKINNIFSAMIDNIISGRLSVPTALTEAENQVTALMR